MNEALSPHGQAAVLIVDDAPANLELLRSMLAQQGFQTFVANSGERALTIARRVLPDLILLDVLMPGMDGLETCRRLKEHAGTERIPVIFMSSSNDTDDVVAGLENGAVDYLGKPLRLAEVCARVRLQLQIRNRIETDQQQALRLRAIVNGMAEGLMIVEASGCVQYANPACARQLGYQGGELAGARLGALLGASVEMEYLDYFARYRADPGAALRQPATREVAILHCDGSTHPMDLTLTPLPGRDDLFIGMLHDIAHHKRHNSALEQAALIDPLTEIANRRHFDQFLECEWQRAVRSGAPLSLIVLDVDHFKLHNDTFGHASGDLALRQVAAAIRAHTLRPTDLAARFGGEEFVLVFAETAAPEARALAEAICRHIESLELPNPHSPTSAWLTVSIGVASIAPTRLDQLSEFFVSADRAMYAAKQAGRNRVHAIDPGNNGWEAVRALIMQ